jgi:hypothetical protein
MCETGMGQQVAMMMMNLWNFVTCTVVLLVSGHTTRGTVLY